jgi:heme/copper-type cytochrome/quinol oxidase subunit 2
MGTLTPDEEKFIEYWEHNRLKKRKITKQLSIGLPIGVLLVLGIFASVFARWDKHADVQMREEMQYTAGPTLILVFIVAALLIVAFFVIFSARHNWDLNEQRYKELNARIDKEL